MIRITHHRIKCIGCNYCAETAPSRWVMNDIDGKSNLLEGTEKKGVHTCVTTDDEFEENKVAADACPVNIIRVEKI